MLRFLGWSIGVLLMLGVLLTSIVGIARQDRTPSLLQRVGYALCDGRPCFRNVTLGTDWTEARNILKEMAKPTFATELNVKIGQGKLDSVRVTADAVGMVNSILTTSDGFRTSLEVMLGDVLVMYGDPCRIGRMRDPASSDDQFILIYPTMAVALKSAIVQMQFPAPIVTVHPNSRIDSIWILNDSFLGGCGGAPFGRWHGFASSQTYLRELEADQRPSQP